MPVLEAATSRPLPPGQQAGPESPQLCRGPGISWRGKWRNLVLAEALGLVLARGPRVPRSHGLPLSDGTPLPRTPRLPEHCDDRAEHNRAALRATLSGTRTGHDTLSATALPIRRPSLPRLFRFSTPREIRTRDLWLRRPTLYPAELGALFVAWRPRGRPGGPGGVPSRGRRWR
jgi:hypothetical protein